MENDPQSTTNKPLKTLEEPELTVIPLVKNDVIATSTPDCLAKGTEITMADGTVKKIEDIRDGDLVLTFDHEAGCFVGKEVLYAYKGDAPKRFFTVHLANGAELSIVGEHDLFEQESRKYVTLTEKNAEQFIGRHFYSVAEKNYVELTGVTHATEAVEYYELYAKETLNTVANGMLNVADDVDYSLNLYELGEDLRADAEVLAADIRKYGLWAYSPKTGYSEEEYKDWRQYYLSIAVGKGLITRDRLSQQHSEYTEQRRKKENTECA